MIQSIKATIKDITKHLPKSVCGVPATVVDDCTNPGLKVIRTINDTVKRTKYKTIIAPTFAGNAYLINSIVCGFSELTFIELLYEDKGAPEDIYL